MHRRISFSLLIIAQLILCVFSISFAEEPDKVEKIIVTGMGMDADKARQNAIRNAVEQVIGTYVSSDTMVKDSLRIKDEILSYSGGYVKESRVISTEKSDDGLFSVKLEALVVSTKLKRKIQTLNIAIKKVDGGSLFAEAFSKATATKSGGNQLSKIMSKYPQAAYHAEIGKPEILTVNNNKNKASVKLNLNLKLDDEFVKELETVLSEISYQQLTNIDISKWGWDDDPISSSKGSLGEDVLVLMFSNDNMLSRSIANRAYFMNDRGSLLKSNKIIGGLTEQNSPFIPNVSIQLCDSSDNVVDVIVLQLHDKFDNYHAENNTQFGFPPLSEYNAPLIMQGMYRSDLLFVINKSVSFDVLFEADISLLDKVASIKASFESTKMKKQNRGK